MEEYYNVKRLALVLAVQAEIEGMKADNLIREQNNESLAYNGAEFDCKAEELKSFAYAHNEQL